MEAVASSSSSLILTSPLNTNTLSKRNRVIITNKYSKSTSSLRSVKHRRLTRRIAAISDVSAVDSGQVQVTWQIIVGAIAGLTPFVVAGIEFSKRIITQRRCEECGGSGLILREKDYLRCPECGGFLPWQSWKRFFSG